MNETRLNPVNTIIVGAGLAGATAARLLAQKGKKVLVLEKRAHVGGSVYDCPNEAGLLVHVYGPHIFHTNDGEVFDLLSLYTGWREYRHRVLANVHGTMLPVPFNFTSLELAFPEEASVLEEKLGQAFPNVKQIPLQRLLESPEAEIRKVGVYVRENIFRRYTEKQWGVPFEQADVSALNRVPVRLGREDGYFLDTWQGMPDKGYTAMVERMLEHPNITVQCGASADIEPKEDGKLYVQGQAFLGDVIYTGTIDGLFGYRLGRLPYRTLDFAFETLEQEQFQPCGTVNYTVDEAFTRITECKQLTGEESRCTTILREYPKACGEADTPYYPIASEESRKLYEAYAALAARYPNLHLCGRLGEYRYYNMDAVVRRAMDLAERL